MSDYFTFDEDETVTTYFDTLIDKKIFGERIVYLDSGVEDDSVSDVIKKLKVLDQATPKAILLIINTDGGCVYNTLRLHDVIRRLSSPVDILVEGKAFSAGAYLVGMSGRTRYAYRNASFMLHEIGGGTYGKLTEQDIDLDESKRLQKLMNKLVKKRSKLSKEVMDRFNNGKDWYFTAVMAKRIGLVDVLL